MTKIITISRQFGSGGRSVGRKTAEKLGIPCYDAEIIQKIAEKSGYSKEYIEEQSESEAGGLFGAFSSADIYGYSGKLTIWTNQCRIIEELAAQGDCVIVGRCADYVLKNGNADLLRVFIYADEKDRVHRIVNEYGETDVKPEKRLREKDKRRKAYYEVYTDQKFGDPVNYDMCLNTSSFGIDGCVDLIAGVFKNK
ncbi:MAG: AAA family ATPase [Bulleidia sp.]